MSDDNNKQQNEWQKRELGALWVREGKSGKYFYGKIGEKTIKKKSLFLEIRIKMAITTPISLSINPRIVRPVLRLSRNKKSKPLQPTTLKKICSK